MIKNPILNLFVLKRAGIPFFRVIFFKITSFRLPLGQKVPHHLLPMKGAVTTGANMHMMATIPTGG